MSENVNEALKLIARTKELLHQFYEKNDIENLDDIADCISLLNDAVDKLAS